MIHLAAAPVHDEFGDVQCCQRCGDILVEKRKTDRWTFDPFRTGAKVDASIAALTETTEEADCAVWSDNTETS